jgi:UDP-N-acetylmuramate dehydrogenase
MHRQKIRKDVNLSNFSTFKIGGKADFFCAPSNFDEIRDAFLFAKEHGLATFILGGGANILISDNGFRGLIISTKNLVKTVIDGENAEAESGIMIDKLNVKLTKKSLSGMEFSGGLPGSLGGAIFMNAKAYGSDFAGITDHVEIINENLEIEMLQRKDMDFSYKKSIFMRRKGIFIYRIGMKLRHGLKNEIKLLYNKNSDDRKNKGQFTFPSAGCVFKNNYDIGIPSGKIIEEMGLKGMKIGGAEIYEKHANFIINKNNAKASDVLDLINLIELKVYEAKGIKLEREVQLLGFDEV